MPPTWHEATVSASGGVGTGGCTCVRLRRKQTSKIKMLLKPTAELNAGGIGVEIFYVPLGSVLGLDETGKEVL